MGAGVCVVMRLAAGVGERVTLELRGGMQVVVSAQGSVCVVMMSLVESRGHMAVRIGTGAVKGVALRGSVRTCVGVTLCLQSCTCVCAV